MNCEEATRLVDAYVDGELDALTNEAIERHLADCPKCERVYQEQQQFVQTIGNRMPYYPASIDLRERIQRELRKEAPGPAAGASVRGQTGPRTHWNWLALAAALIVGAFAGVLVAPALRHSDANQFLATELISSHARALMAGHLTDVASSDQHTVKPWLDNKLDYAPAVPELASEGFPLIGGRLDYINNRAVAALVYQRRKHYINVFVWPDTGNTFSSQNAAMARQGYHLLSWRMGDLDYWAVSDVNADDLRAFQAAFERLGGGR